MLRPSQGLRSQGASPDTVTPGLKGLPGTSSALRCAPQKRRSWPGGRTSPPPALQPAVRHRRHPREVSVPRCPGQSQPMAMLLPRDGGSRGKPGPRTAFFFFCVPEEHSSPAPCTSPAKAPGCPLLRQPILSPPPPPPRAMRHVESPSWSHSPGKKPRRVGNGPLCNGAGGESRCSQNPVWGRAGALPFPSRALRETRAAKTCFSQAEKVRFFCPPATEPTRLRPAPKPTKSSQCCSAENACGRWGKRASRLAIDIPISTALAISSYRYMYH